MNVEMDIGRVEFDYSLAKYVIAYASLLKEFLAQVKREYDLC